MSSGWEANDLNPKTKFGALKAPLHLVPPSAVAAEAKAFADGAEKYGPYNWRKDAVSVSTYVAAARRHLDAFWDGENIVPDSKAGAHHLAAVRACMAILIDAEAVGMLVDDRPAPLPPMAVPVQECEKPLSEGVAHRVAILDTDDLYCPHQLARHMCRECLLDDPK